MVDVELTFVEDKINNLFTNKTTATLAITQTVLELFSLLGGQC